MAKQMADHAMINAENPMATANKNMASSPLFSIAATVSVADPMKINPPEMRQKPATSSLGGLLGKRLVGGDR